MQQKNSPEKVRDTVGVLVDALGEDFQTQILEGISSECLKRDIDLIIFSNAKIIAEIEYFNNYQSFRKIICQNELSGLIILSGSIAEHTPAAEIINLMNNLKMIPTISIGMEIPTIPSILSDNKEEIKKLLTHLTDTHNYSRIAFIRGPLNHEEAEIRFTAYKEFMESKQLPLDKDLIELSNTFSEKDGKEAMINLLNKSNNKIDVVVAADDCIAIGALRALKERKIKVPEEIALAGYDNNNKANTVSPSLTTIEQQYYQQGKTAIVTLYKLLKGKSVDAKIIMPSPLIIRNSCGCSNSYNFQRDSYKKTPFSKENKETINRLAKSLLEALNSQNNKNFLDLLENELVTDFSNSNSISSWNDFICAIFKKVQNNHSQFNDCFSKLIYSKAQEKIINFQRREQHCLSLREIETQKMMHILSHKLLSVFKLNDLLNVIHSQLSSLHINTCFLVLYHSDAIYAQPLSIDEIPQTGDLIIGIKDGKSVLHEKEKTTFSLSTSVLNKWMDSKKRKEYLFLPVSFKEKRYGYIIFEFNKELLINIYDTLIIILGSALHGCELMYNLEKSTEQKTNLFFNITHEMKTPLTIASSYLEKYMVHQDNLKDLCVVQQNINKLNNDVQNFTDISKFEKNQIFYTNTSQINFSQALRKKIIEFREIANSDNIKISLSCPKDLYINIDPSAFERIFNNLFDNAIRYNKPEGIINIEVQAYEQELKVKIANTGKNIDRKNYSTFFKPFFQASREKSNYQGLGIGLSIVKNIFDYIGGSICICHENGMTTFKFAFPRISLKKNASSIQIKSEISPKAGIINTKLKTFTHVEEKDTILIVDDNYQMLAFLAESLHPIYNVYCAKDGEKALIQLLKIPKPDLILSDIMMDKMDGYQLLTELKKQKKYSATPFLFFSAKGTIKNRLEGLKSGAVDYIPKPFLLEELLTKIKTLLKYKYNIYNQVKEKMNNDLMDYLNIKETEIISENISTSCNQYGLTAREVEIIYHIKSGKLQKEIAVIMNISGNTIKSHIYRIYKKCQINNKIELLNLEI